MKKNFKIVQLAGLSGIFLIGFVGVCLVCGFIIFPVWLLNQAWNYVALDVMHASSLSMAYYQSGLLWAIISLFAYVNLKKYICVQIKDEDFISEDDIKKASDDYEKIKELKEVVEQNVKEASLSEDIEEEVEIK